MGASSSSGLAVKGVNSAIRRVASDQNKVRHIMQSKHEWTKVTKKNQQSPEPHRLHNNVLVKQHFFLFLIVRSLFLNFPSFSPCY